MDQCYQIGKMPDHPGDELFGVNEGHGFQRCIHKLNPPGTKEKVILVIHRCIGSLLPYL